MVLSKADVEKFVNRLENSVKDPKMRKMKKLEIARLYKDAKLPQKAKECIEEYMDVNKKDHRALNLLGAINEDLGEWEDALKCYKKSIELACSQKDIFLKIIEVYSKVPRIEPEIAMVWADKAAKIFPHHPSVFNLKWNLMMCSVERDYDEMEDILAQELVANPRDVSLHIKLVNLYIEKGDLDEAYAHCASIIESRAFHNSQEWLKCAANVFESVFNKKKDPAERVEAYMKYLPVLCLLVENSVKNSTVLEAKTLIQRLDKAVNEAMKISPDALVENLRSEVEVWQTEMQGQLYFYMAEVILKMAKECEIAWNVATKFAFGLFSTSSTIKEPNPKAPWFIQKSSEKNHTTMIWYTMACKRLSQTNHQILSMLKTNGDTWIKSSLLDACSEAGKKELIERIFQENFDAANSFFANDKEFIKPEFKLPNTEDLAKYDEIAIKENPEDLNFLVWIGVNWHFLSASMKLEAHDLVRSIFFDIKMDVDNIKNCSPFSVSSKDLEVFTEAVIFSAYKRFVADTHVIKDKTEPVLLPVAIGPDFVTSCQKELWDATYKLHTGKTWQSSTSKLKSIVQKGLETLRIIDNHGIDPRILKYVSDMFLSKAEEMLNDDSNTWKNQAHLESLQKRGYYYAIEALRLFETSNSHEISQPKRLLIQPLPKPLKETERHDLITEIRMAMADAAFREGLHQSALKYLGELYTADSAYKEAQVYRDLATKENLTNIEGLRNHLSNLRKSREKLLTCLSRLEETQESLRNGVQAEIDEIRDAIAEQSGISAAPSKILDFRYSMSEVPDDDEGRSFEDATQQGDDSNTDSKLALENSMLHEQLAVRNHEFSVLAQRIYKLEREIVDLRKNHSGSESMLRSANNSTSLSGNTDETSSSVAHAPKDDATSGSGNLTPRLEPEMSWDPFSPAPVFPVFDKGFFSGLAETVDKIEEETEAEMQETEVKEEDKGNEMKKTDGDDRDRSKEDIDDEKVENDDHDGDNIHVEPVVQLTKKSNQRTGEEDEKIMFMERAKLYRLSDNQWKERGVGDFKILQNSKTRQSRILMRRDHVLRICANHVITNDMKMAKKDQSATTFIWYTVADMSEEDAKAETFAVRFKNQEIAEKFLKAFTSCQNKEALHDSVSAAGSDVTNKMASLLPSASNKVIGEAKTDEKNVKKVEEKKSFAFAPAKLNFSKEETEKPKDETKKFDFSAFKFSLGAESSKSTQEESKENSGAQNSFKFTSPQLFSTENQNKEEEKKFKFATAGFKFGEKTDENSAQNNPFLAAAKNMFGGENQTSSPFNFTSNKKQTSAPFKFDSPFSFSSPSSSQPATQSTPKISFPIMQLQDQSTVLSNTSATSNQRDTQNIFAQTPTTSFGSGAHGIASNYESTPDQNAYFQSNWEAAQDQYYCEGAYADQDQYYADENGYYDNEEYYNGSGYYSNDEDDEDDEDDEGNVYYDDGEVDYYDQEAVRPVNNADSDANSDRQSPQSASANQEEPVPRVVQMIDEDVFVTYVKKASFAERARAARFQLPSTFFSPSSRPPCPGCLGCSSPESPEPTEAADKGSESEQAKTASVAEAPKSLGKGPQKEETPAAKATSASSSVLGASSSFMSFADLMKTTQNTSAFQSGATTAKGFSGAGSVLFSSDKNEDDPEAYDPQYKAIIELEKKENQSTGEEGYHHLFKHRAKLYRFDSESKQWKERGVGDMKLSHNPSNNYCRVIMRRDIIHKICANHPVMPDIELKPHDLSPTSLVWVSGADYSEGEPSVEKFAVKFKNVEICNEFKKVFEECKKKMVYYVENLKRGETQDVKDSGGNAEQNSEANKSSNASKENSTLDEQNVDKSDIKNEDDSKSVWAKFASKEGSWVCDVCEVKNTPEKTACASCTAAKPGSRITPGEQKVDSVSTSGFSFGVPQQSKNGILFGSSKPISFGTSAFSGSSIIFGRQAGQDNLKDRKDGSILKETSPGKTGSSANNADAKLDQKPSPNAAAKADTSLIATKTIPQEDKTIETEEVSQTKASSSVWSKFAGKEGSWVCGVCEVKNTPDKTACVSCTTPKPGSKSMPAEQKDGSGSGFVFGNMKQSQTGILFGSSKPVSFGTSTFAGSSFVFGKPVEKGNLNVKEDASSLQETPSGKTRSSGNNTDARLDQKSSSAADKIDAANSATSSSQHVQSKSSTSVWSKFAAKEGSWVCNVCEVKNTPDKTACVSCTAAKPGSKSTPAEQKDGTSSGFVFGATKPAQSGLLFGSSKPITFGTPSISSSAFSFGQPGNQFTSIKKPEFGVSSPQTETEKKDDAWECPTCSMQNDATRTNCSGCKTENPSTKQKSSTPFVLKKSPLQDKLQKSDLKQLFAPKPGSWECPTCLIQNDSTAQPCPACTTPKPKSDNESSTKLFPSGLSSSFSTPKNNTGFKFSFGNQTQTNSKDESADTSQYFTPSGLFTFGSQGGEIVEQMPTAIDKAEPQEPESPSKGDDHSLSFTPIVELKKKEQRVTGEESEDVIFVEKAKLYRFDLEAKQWKERGVGEMKILFKKDSGKYRIVMRREQVHKLCANHNLMKGMSLKPMENSEKAFIWTANADYCDEEVKSEMFAVKFKSVERGKDFQKAFESAVKEDENEKEKTSDEISSGKQKTPSTSPEALSTSPEAVSVQQEARSASPEAHSASPEVRSAFLKGEEKDSKEDKLEVKTTEMKSQEEKAFDLKLTYQFIPDQDDKQKADKLLLPKEFFHVPTTQTKSPTKEEKVLPDENKGSASSPEKYQNEEECKAVFTPLVELKKVDFKSGEEREEVLFCEKAKIYRLDSSVPQWKERGSGDLKMLKNNNTGQVRLIMRRDQVKKLCLNHLVLNGMKLEDSEMAKRTVVWFTLADFSDGEAKAEKFAARFKTDDAVNQFKVCFSAAVSDSGSVGTRDSESEVKVNDGPEVIESSVGVKAVEEVTAKSDMTQVQEDNRPKLLSNEASKQVTSSTDTVSNTPISFSFLPTQDDATTKQYKPPKPLFDFSSQSQTGGGFEFPATGLFSVGSLGSSDQNVDADEKQADSEDAAEILKENESGPKTGTLFGAFDWGKVGNLFTLKKDEKDDKPNGEGGKEGSSLQAPVLSFTFGKSDKTQTFQQEGGLGQAKSDDKDKETEISQKPKFSFMFGQSDKSKQPEQETKSGEAKSSGEERKETTSSQKATIGFVFGQPEKNQQHEEKSKVDEAKSKEDDVVKSEFHEEEECKANFEAIVTLQKKEEQKTGEENEETIFSERAKAYRYDIDGPQWKERGVGEIKILMNNKNGQYRILMRRDQVKKICINHLILSEMKMEKNEASKNSWVWFCHADYSEDVAKPEKFAVRFRNEDAFSRFKECFDKAKSEIGDATEAGDLTEEGPVDDIDAKDVENDAEEKPVVILDVQEADDVSERRQVGDDDAKEARQDAEERLISDAGETKEEDVESKKGYDAFAKDVNVDKEETAIEVACKENDERDSVGQKNQSPLVEGTATENYEDVQPGSSIDDQLQITYVKEASIEDREKAERMLLPSLFFTTDNFIKIAAKQDKAKSKTVNLNQSQSSGVSQFGFQTTGLSFSDLLKPSSADNKQGFLTNSGKPFGKQFENQGQALFKTSSGDNNEEEAQIHFTPIVALEKKEIKTGEEDEECLFDERCKLYRCDSKAVQWKERGVGKLKILHNKRRNTYRIIMRRDQVFKICANHLIHADMKPMPRQGVETTWLWMTNADISDGAAQEELFTARFKTAEIGKAFAETIEKCCAALQCKTESMTELETHSVSESVNESANESTIESAAGDSTVKETRKEEEIGEQNVKSIFSASMDGWECNDCLVFNKWNEIKCVACGYERKDKAIKSSKSGNLQDDNVTSSTTYQQEKNDCNKDGPNNSCSIEKEEIKGDTQSKETPAASNDADSEEHAFGSAFSSMSFASLASSNSQNAFSSPKKGGEFSGAGRVLFGGSNEKDDTEVDPHFEPIVQLAKVETKSGEENEAIMFENRVKLYKFNSESKQWKERGVGNLKLLRHSDNGRGRLVMRREQVHKLCANHALADGMKLEKMTSSNRTLMWKTLADVSDGTPEETLLAARFKSDDVMNEFQRVFEMLCEKREMKIEEKSNEVGENVSNVVGSCCPSITADLQDLIK